MEQDQLFSKHPKVFKKPCFKNDVPYFHSPKQWGSLGVISLKNWIYLTTSRIDECLQLVEKNRLIGKLHQWLGRAEGQGRSRVP